MSDQSWPVIDVCVCTFRRQSLLQTLESVLGQNFDRPFRIIVADNDETPSGRPIVEALIAGGAPIHYVHAPARNISVARNACLDAAAAPFVAWIDDDENADPDWLTQLHVAIQDKDAVFGRVIALYPDDAPDWIVKADLHSTRATETERGVITGYTSNALVRRAAAGDARFDVALGRSGGEDTDFFTRMHQGGARLGAASDAIVREPTAPARLSLQWLSQRSFRAGQTHARNYLTSSGGRVKGVVVAGAKAVACLAAAGLYAFDPVKSRALWVRAALHRGVVARLVGTRDVQIY